MTDEEVRAWRITTILLIAIAMFLSGLGIGLNLAGL